MAPRLVRALVHCQGGNLVAGALRKDVVKDDDGQLYARYNNRWWRLALGDGGIYSFAVGISEESLLSQRLDDFLGQPCSN